MKERKSILWIAASMVGMLAIIAGCGGGGGAAASPPGVISVISGIVSDGPIRNARVTLDLNGNGKYDDGEPFGITNEKGEYRIEYILDPGKEYLLIADGADVLGTSDTLDNPGDGTNLTFTMFVAVATSGEVNSPPVAGSYRRDVTPVTFRNYLTDISGRVGGISDANVQDIVNSTDGPVALFQALIKDKHAVIQTAAGNIAGVLVSANEQKELVPIKGDLGVSAEAVLDMVEGATLQQLSGLLSYQGRTVSLIGDMVVSNPVAPASVVDVLLTNINPKETNPSLAFTVKPGSLAGYTTSVTPYSNILDIPAYDQIRAGGQVVYLGADISTRDASGVRTAAHWLSCTAASTSANAFDGLVYYYFDGTNWIRGGAITAAMNIRTAPFVIVKVGKTVSKTLNITGLSQLNYPAVVIRGYMPSDAAKTVVTLDALAISPASDTVAVYVPEGFIISEVVVVDGELAKVNLDGKPSISLPVIDSVQGTAVTTVLSSAQANVITDGTLYDALRKGSQDQNFAGVGSYIDTKTAYRAISMYLGLNIDAAVKAIINENINRFLDSSTPLFYEGSGSYPGVTFDSVHKRIDVAIAENDASTTISWVFSANRIVRTHRRDVVTGSGRGSVYTSTCTFSNAALSKASEKLINAVLTESVTEMYDGARKISALYDGSMVYDRTNNALLSAKYNQRFSETNLTTQKTDSLEGLMMIVDNGALSFNGSYAFNLRSYGAVTGTLDITKGICAKAYNALEGLYFNNNDLTNASAIFTTSSAYSVPVVPPDWLIGVWNGTFTDSGDPSHSGNMGVIVTKTNATWGGQSYDRARNYGTKMEFSGSTAVTVRLMNEATLWSSGRRINDGRIEGTWSNNGFSGDYVLTKIP